MPKSPKSHSEKYQLIKNLVDFKLPKRGATRQQKYLTTYYYNRLKILAKQNNQIYRPKKQKNINILTKQLNLGVSAKHLKAIPVPKHIKGKYKITIKKGKITFSHKNITEINVALSMRGLEKNYKKEIMSKLRGVFGNEYTFTIYGNEYFARVKNKKMLVEQYPTLLDYYGAGRVNGVKIFRIK